MKLERRRSPMLLKWRWYAWLFWDRVQVWHLVLLALLITWLGLSFIVNSSLDHDVRRLKAAAAGLHDHSAPVVSQTERISIVNASEFTAFLPSIGESANQLRALFVLASRNQCNLFNLESKPRQIAAKGIYRQPVQIGTVGTEAAIRNYLHSLVLELPNLSIDNLVLAVKPEQPDQIVLTVDGSLYFK